MAAILCKLLCLTVLVFDFIKCQEDFGNEFDCGGTKQSPIDIKTKDLIQKVYKDLHWSKEYGKKPIKMSATGGHSLTIGTEYSNGAVPTIWGGPLPMHYKLVQFHFHWAQSDKVGSEHLVNGNSYLMEMHAVHIKENLTFAQATQDKNGIAVVAYFFDYALTPSHAIAHLIDSFRSVLRNRTAPVTLAHPFPINQLVRPISCNYVTYSGSLTTPPCAENVIWIVSPYVITLTRHQMTQFRDLAKNGAITVNNYRTLQNTNARNVYYAVRESAIGHHDYTVEDPEATDFEDRELYDDSIHFEDANDHYDENNQRIHF